MVNPASVLNRIKKVLVTKPISTAVVPAAPVVEAPVDLTRREAIKRAGAQSLLNSAPGVGTLTKLAADPALADVVKVAAPRLSAVDKSVADSAWWSIGEGLMTDPRAVNGFFTDIYKAAEPRLKAKQRRQLLDAMQSHASGKTDAQDSWNNLYDIFGEHVVGNLSPEQLTQASDKYLTGTKKFSDMTIPELRQFIEISFEEATGDLPPKSAVEKTLKRLRGE